MLITLNNIKNDVVNIKFATINKILANYNYLKKNHLIFFILTKNMRRIQCLNI